MTRIITADAACTTLAETTAGWKGDSPLLSTETINIYFWCCHFGDKFSCFLGSTQPSSTQKFKPNPATSRLSLIWAREVLVPHTPIPVHRHPLEMVWFPPCCWRCCGTCIPALSTERIFSMMYLLFQIAQDAVSKPTDLAANNHCKPEQHPNFQSSKSSSQLQNWQLS